MIEIIAKLNQRRTYIFGGGKQGIDLDFLLEEIGVYVEAFIDNSEEKQKILLRGKKCISLEEAINEGAQECNIIVPPSKNEMIIEQLKSKNIKYVYDGNHILSFYKKYLYFFPKKYESDDYKAVKPFNFYDSPYPDIEKIHKKELEIFDENKLVLDINYNIKQQLVFLEKFNEIEHINWEEDKSKKYRYYYNNSFFGKGSADILHYMLRIIKPKKIIEVGSGFSTAVMLDTNNYYLNDSIEINSIEPNSDRLKSLLKEGDNIQIYEKDLQDISLDFFDRLKENDILFIDSSHVAKVNSDVNYYLFEIFPRLSKGVYIHIHDIYYPFIYSKQWIYEGRAYNEAYLLRAFLMNNDRYSIQFWGTMLKKKCPDRIDNKFRAIFNSGSIWLKKEC